MPYLIFHIACGLVAIMLPLKAHRRESVSLGLVFVSVMFGPLSLLLFGGLMLDEIRQNKKHSQPDD